MKTKPIEIAFLLRKIREAKYDCDLFNIQERESGVCFFETASDFLQEAINNITDGIEQSVIDHFFNGKEENIKKEEKINENR